MKKIIFLVLMIILLLMLCSCNKSYENQVASARFIKIENYELGAIVVDSETNVEYWMSEAVYNKGTLTMLVNEDGSPKIRKCEY